MTKVVIHGKTCDMEGERLNEGKKKLPLKEESWKLGGSVSASEMGWFLFFKKEEKKTEEASFLAESILRVRGKAGRWRRGEKIWDESEHNKSQRW